MSRITSDYGRDELTEQYRTQQERKSEMQEQSETEIENMKRSYSAQKADLEDRFERSIQSEKLQHYENLRNQKSQIQREQMQLETAGRQAVKNQIDTFGKEEHQAKVEGESKVRDIQQKYASAEEYERQRFAAAQEEIRGEHHKNTEQILQDSEQRIGKLREEKSQLLEKAQATHAEALHQMEDHYTGLRSGVQNQYESGLKNLYQRTQDELSQKQLTHAKLIETYQRRAEDPFYRLQRYDSDLLDVGDEYVLRVKVPDYERGQFRVQVSGQEVQLVGIRTNQEKTEVEPGRWISTSSHQSVSERYALDSPVDGRAMTMREEGDWLEYHLPKFTKNHRYSDTVQPKRADVSDANMIREIEFPKSLPRPTISKKDSGPIGSSNV